MLRLVAEGSGANFAQAPFWGDRIPEGGQGELQVAFRFLPAGWTAKMADLSNRLVADRVQLTAPVRTVGNTLSVRYRKGVDPLTLIVTIIIAVVVLAVVIASWRLFNVVAAVPLLGPFLAPALLIVGGVLAIGYLLRWSRPRLGGG